MSLNQIVIGVKPVQNTQPYVPIKIENYSYYPSDQIGLGYISHVFLGRNDHTGELVAIKIINFSKEDELGLNLIQQEINILQKIKKGNCQNLLIMHDHFKIDSNLYIITEFCPDKDVAKILRKCKIMSQTQAQTIMKQLVQAYLELHCIGIVHRDLKLANVLIKEGRIKLADFGFSISIEKCQEKCNYNVGSPYYMPPETLKYNVYSFKSDIWALGIIAYEMVYGHLPWKDKIQSVLYDKILATNIETIFDPQVNVSQCYRQFIKACLQVNPQNRATSQFIQNFVWPLAKNQVRGLVPEPNSRPFSMMSEMNALTKRKIVSQPCIQIQQSNKPIHLNSISSSTTFLGKKYQSSSKERTFLKQNAVNYETNFNLAMRSIQSIITTQLNFCFFIKNLSKLLQETYLSEGYLLRYELSKDVALKIRELQRLDRGENCVYQSLPLINQYKKTQSWMKLKSIIKQYSQSKNDLFEKIILSTNAQIAAKCIKELKENIMENFEVLEQLCYYFQLRKLEQSTNLEQFAANSKLQILSTRKRSKHELKTAVLCQRLANKLSLLQL